MVNQPRSEIVMGRVRETGEFFIGFSEADVVPIGSPLTQTKYLAVHFKQDDLEWLVEEIGKQLAGHYDDQDSIETLEG